MSRKYIIAGNWKMNTLSAEAAELTRAASIAANTANKNVQVVVIPPFIHIANVVWIASDSKLKIGAQNCHFAPSGAFTGEISAPMIASTGCTYCLAGHSERRQYFGETDETVAKKTIAILAAGMTPIVCIGETLQERQSGMTLQVVEQQMNAVIDVIGIAGLKKIVIAYEPVWAIGTGLAASPSQAQEVHRFIREVLVQFVGDVAAKIPILYGGSVTDSNAGELFSQQDIDGGLVGGASLKADVFVGIIVAAANASRSQL